MSNASLLVPNNLDIKLGPQPNLIPTAPQGSMLVANVTGNFVPLAPGTVGQVLTMVGGVPTWV